MDGVGSPRRGQFPGNVGRYELLLPIGKGGMATVFLARARGVRGFEREVALKLARGEGLDDADAAFDLVEEAKLASRIRHLNVVSVLDVGDDLDGVYLVMDYIEGDSLRALAQHADSGGQRVPVPVAVRILADALAGLHAAHEVRDDAGAPLHLVHRDVSPHNVLVGLDGIARLSDFGIAKVQSREGGTRTGIIKGKVRYMSPEQAMGKALDRRTDVWAAGVVAWELLAGRRLYEGTEDVATALLVVSRDPPLLRDVAPDVPAALSDAVAAALVREPAKRLPTADALRLRLLEAAAASDPADVQRYVQAAAGDRLQERRRQVDAILRDRAGGRSVDVGAVGTTVEATEARQEHRAVSPPSRTWRLALGLPATMALALAVAFGVRALRAIAVSAVAPTLEPSASAMVEASAAPAALGAPSAVAADPSAMPVVAADALRVTANAPLRRLEINGRRLAVVPPSSSAAIALTASESRGTPTIVATAVDGRRARGSAHGGAVAIWFAPPSRTADSPHAHLAATVAAPTGGTQPPPLLPDTLKGP